VNINFKLGHYPMASTLDLIHDVQCMMRPLCMKRL
jgi:hypothetical protein